MDYDNRSAIVKIYSWQWSPILEYRQSTPLLWDLDTLNLYAVPITITAKCLTIVDCMDLQSSSTMEENMGGETGERNLLLIQGPLGNTYYILVFSLVSPQPPPRTFPAFLSWQCPHIKWFKQQDFQYCLPGSLHIHTGFPYYRALSLSAQISLCSF